jgi:aspartate racemase
MPRHIGIVGCSAEGAALCYRTICVEGAQLLGEYAHPEVSLHTPPLSEYVACLERDDWTGVAQLMLASARKLAKAGAEFLICPDNTIHRALPEVETHSPLPWLHIADVVAARAVERGFHCLGLTGTRWLVDSEVYPDRLTAASLRYLRPTSAERDEVNRIIMEELVRGLFKPASTGYLQRVIARMKNDGCDAVVLGCTEIPLIIDDSNSPLPVLDSTRLLARAALRRAVGADVVGSGHDALCPLPSALRQEEAGPPDLAGVWRANLAKSTLRIPIPRELLVDIDHREPVIVQRMTVVAVDGAEQQLTFTYRTDGQQSSNVTPNGEAQTRARWVGSVLVIETTLRTPTRTFSFKDYWTLSADRQTLTMAHPDDDLAGQVAVLERVFPETSAST